MDYNEIFHQIDLELIAEDIPIFQRLEAASNRLEKRLNMQLPLFQSLLFQSPSFSEQHNRISRELNKWYTNKYGNKLNISCELGTFSIEIQNDIWIITVPLVYGRVNFYIHPDLNFNQPSTNANNSNILSYCQGMTQNYIHGLSDNDFEKIGNSFVLAFNFFRYFDALRLRNEKLINMAMTDFEQAQKEWENRFPNYAIIKWNYAQFMEKILKYELIQLGETESKLKKISHNIIKLAELYNKSMTEKTICIDEIINIDTKSNARYGELDITKNQALTAQFSVFNVFTSLYG